MKDSEFKKKILIYYAKNKRFFPWRETTDPYKVLVSELMLQQTQVSRVQIKYKEFLQKFPALEKLSEAKQSDVLSVWQGLGYNRRALNLKKTCSIIFKVYKGKFPKDYNQLIGLPGIGQSTAGALLNFSFNIPTPFIETNIRSVYIHFYFSKHNSVTDKELLPIIERTLDLKNPREWFFALYDYGTYLKSQLGKKKTELHTKSKHYTKQKPFKGSNREIRSKILKIFISNKNKEMSLLNLKNEVKISEKVLSKNLNDLTDEGFLLFSSKKSLWRLKP
jgi:A/G-specific adenine glycosylase